MKKLRQVKGYGSLNYVRTFSFGIPEISVPAVLDQLWDIEVYTKTSIEFGNTCLGSQAIHIKGTRDHNYEAYRIISMIYEVFLLQQCPANAG